MICRICVACNDHRNGQDRGRAEAVEIDFGNDGLGRVSLVGGSITTKQLDGGFVRLGRLKLKSRSYSYWFGNWCWNSFTVALPDAVRVLNYIIGLESWHCEEAEDWLYNAFNARVGVLHSDPRFFV